MTNTVETNTWREGQGVESFSAHPFVSYRWQRHNARQPVAGVNRRPEAHRQSSPSALSVFWCISRAVRAQKRQTDIKRLGCCPSTQPYPARFKFGQFHFVTPLRRPHNPAVEREPPAIRPPPAPSLLRSAALYESVSPYGWTLRRRSGGRTWSSPSRALPSPTPGWAAEPYAAPNKSSARLPVGELHVGHFKCIPCNFRNLLCLRWMI